MSKSSLSTPILKRFLTDNPVEYEQAIAAAEAYASQLSVEAFQWLYIKPFDPTPGHREYFRLMYDCLNLLQVMAIPSQGRILEVGTGPGWITELLLMLGFRVDALEPSQDLIKIAQDRCNSLKVHHRNDVGDQVTFHHTTLEKIEFESESFDAIIFYDVLHHVVNEEIAIEKCFRFLKKWGSLGIVDPAWHPDFTQLQQFMREEMEKYGTLENPFSTEYLDYLLEKTGFTDITRYVAVNGFFSQEQLSDPLEKYALCPYHGSNNVTARKPCGDYPECYHLEFKTDSEWLLKSCLFDESKNSVSITFNLKNIGETFWNNNQRKRGYVNIALKKGVVGTENFKEALQRYPLSEVLIPGNSLEKTLTFTLPPNSSVENWELDLVCEGYYWFSSRGISACPVTLNI